MSQTNAGYSKFCQELVKDLPQRTKDVLLRRFGLSPKLAEGETLEAIGKSYGITRERVRQIERDGFLRLKEGSKTSKAIFQPIESYIKSEGGLKKEDVLLDYIGGKNEKNQVYFLLTLGDQFESIGETEDFFPLWTVDKNALTGCQKFLTAVRAKLEKAAKPMPFEKLAGSVSLSQKQANSFLEVSKKIQKNSEGLLGMSDWPEINPRGIKDKAYLTFKKAQKPLHFTEVASLIGKALPQTVHNELIKDQRFVLVGRGMYALGEWGYKPGFVKDVILDVLKGSGKPMGKDEILQKVMKQRLVQENTVLLNLGNKSFFERTSEGKYTPREA